MPPRFVDGPVADADLYLAYEVVWGYTDVLGDRIDDVPIEDIPRLVIESVYFIKAMRRNGRDPSCRYGRG